MYGFDIKRIEFIDKELVRRTKSESEVDQQIVIEAISFEFIK